jgi:hypothetical protein
MWVEAKEEDNGAGEEEGEKKEQKKRPSVVEELESAGRIVRQQIISNDVCDTLEDAGRDLWGEECE